MNIVSTLFLALSMSADAFAVAAGKGACMKKPHPIQAMKMGAVFGLVESTAPIAGWALGSIASSFVTSVDHWIAFVILLGLGIKMIMESFSTEQDACKPDEQHLPTLILTAVGSSIDSMGVGVSLAFIDANIWLTALCIGLSTFTMASIGIMIGHHIGARVGKAAESAGGVVLILIGTLILLEHTGHL